MTSGSTGTPLIALALQAILRRPGGRKLSSRNGRAGAAITFNLPIGVAVAGDGSVYVGATNGNQIFKLTLAP